VTEPDWDPQYEDPDGLLDDADELPEEDREPEPEPRVPAVRPRPPGPNLSAADRAELAVELRRLRNLRR
jgi:hypothetical protein